MITTQVSPAHDNSQAKSFRIMSKDSKPCGYTFGLLFVRCCCTQFRYSLVCYRSIFGYLIVSCSFCFRSTPCCFFLHFLRRSLLVSLAHAAGRFPWATAAARTRRFLGFNIRSISDPLLHTSTSGSFSAVSTPIFASKY